MMNGRSNLWVSPIKNSWTYGRLDFVERFTEVLSWAFFAPLVKYAFYRQYDVPLPAITIAKLVKLMHLPPATDMQKDFTTVLLILTTPNNVTKVDSAYIDSCNTSLLQETKNRWYTAMRIALGKHMMESSSNSFEASPPWMGHALLSADAHELRSCDVYSELWRWKDNVKFEKERGEKNASLAFIVALHNFWSPMMELERGTRSGVCWESNKSTHDEDPRGYNAKSEAWENYAILSNSERVQSFVRKTPSDVAFHED